MASGSLHKKKHSKRSNLKAHTAMASRPNSSSNHKKSYLIVSVLLVISAVFLLGISASLRSKFKSHDESFPRIYTIEVVNEFPHDPHAFTQVTICVKFSFYFFLNWFYGLVWLFKLRMSYFSFVSCLHSYVGILQWSGSAELKLICVLWASKKCFSQFYSIEIWIMVI